MSMLLPLNFGSFRTAAVEENGKANFLYVKNVMYCNVHLFVMEN